MSLVVPSLRGIVASAPWAKNELWRKAQAVPTLDLRFADSKSLADAISGQNLITFTRASSGTYVGSDGLIKTALADAPRFDHDPVTSESLGLLIEEQRTNSIRNNTMAGAVVGTPGTLPTNWTQTVLGSGLTSQVVSVGTQGGINYVDVRVSGTTGDTLGWAVAFDGSTQIVASSGQSWSGSIYVAIIGGSLDGTTSQFFRIVERSGAGSYVTESNVTWNTVGSSFGPSSRLSVTRPSMGATTGYVQAGMYFQTVIDAAIDITLRIGMPQLEQGAFATSVIPTTSAQVTRNADVASITGSNFSSWYRQDEGTVFSSFSIPTSVTTGGARVYNISNSSFTTQVWLRLQGGTNRLYEVTDSSTQQAALSAGTFSAGVVYKGAVAAKTNDFGFSENGATPTTDNSGTLGNADRMGIGMDSNGIVPLNGHLSRLTYFNSRLPSATLQAITSP